MAKRLQPVSIVGVTSLLLMLAGCSFFGGEEAEYTFWEPALSPDGRILVYESNSESSLELFTLELETRAERRLTDNEYADWSPAWSPDGGRIALASSRDKNVDIYVIDVASLEVVRITSHESDDINPHWGSDGLIYFNSNRSDTWEVYSMDPATLNLTKLTSTGATP